MAVGVGLANDWAGRRRPRKTKSPAVALGGRRLCISYCSEEGKAGESTEERTGTYDVMRDCQKVNVAQPNPILRSTQAPTSSHPRHATTAGPRDVEKVLHYRSTLLCVRGVNCSWSLEHRFCFRPKVEVFRSVGQRCRLRRAETHTHTQVCLEFCEGCVNFVRSFLVDRPRLLDRRVLLLVSLLS